MGDHLSLFNSQDYHETFLLPGEAHQLLIEFFLHEVEAEAVEGKHAHLAHCLRCFTGGANFVLVHFPMAFRILKLFLFLLHKLSIFLAKCHAVFVHSFHHISSFGNIIFAFFPKFYSSAEKIANQCLVCIDKILIKRVM